MIDKKQYITPEIKKIVVDNLISLVMVSEDRPPDDPFDPRRPPPSPQNSGENGNNSSQFNSPMTQHNSFDDNPFK